MTVAGIISKISKLTDALSKVLQATDGALTSLEDVRGQIAAAKEQRTAIENAPLPRAEAESAIRAQIAALALRFDPPFGPIANPGAALDRYWGEFKSASERNPMAFAAALAPENLFSLATRSFDTVYASGDGMSAATKAGELAALDEKLLSLELAEEALIRAMEGGGLTALRRADADPRAVLAADSEMPS